MRKQTTPPPMGAGRRQSADILRLLAQGKIDATGEVTLTAGAASTLVDSDGAIYASETSCVVLMARTANAAAAQASGALYVVPADTQFVIYHPNNAQTDRTFAYAVLG